MGKKSTAIFLLGLAVGVMLGVALSKKERRELLANYAKRIVKRVSRHKNRQYDESEARRATD
jgi:hypothetical protein